MSDLLNSKRDLSPQLGKKILSKLVIEKEQQQKFSGQIEKDINKKVSLLPKEAQALVEKWYYFAILNILELHQTPTNIPEIAKRLGLPEAKVKKGIEALVSWEFVKRENNNYVFMTNAWQTTDGIPSASVRKAHLEGLELAAQALEQLPLEMRDVTSLVFNGNSKQLEKVRIEIRKFIQKVNKIMSVGEADTVYRFNAQLFPIDRWNQRSENTKK